MNKVLKCIISLLFILSLVSCQSENTKDISVSNNTVKNDVPILKEVSPNSKNDILVVYFSQDDSVSEDANIIKDYLFADFSELVPVDAYSKEDLDINNPNSRINIEINDDTIRPAISNSPTNINKYKWIFLGFPVWKGKMPKIIYTFLEKYDFKDKYIFPFCKNASSDAILENIRDDINILTQKSNPIIYPVKNIPDGEFVGNITAWVDWCNPTTEYDEGLLPEEVTTTETEEPDLSEILVKNN